jgi:hypothetical protein
MKLGRITAHKWTILSVITTAIHVSILFAVSNYYYSSYGIRDMYVPPASKIMMPVHYYGILVALAFAVVAMIRERPRGYGALAACLSIFSVLFYFD